MIKVYVLTDNNGNITRCSTIIGNGTEVIQDNLKNYLVKNFLKQVYLMLQKTIKNIKDIYLNIYP